ncbi:MAG: hypothetical protein P8X96_24345 [Desulfobacteraceae bacterium]|jgi:hypothetical protein
MRANKRQVVLVIITLMVFAGIVGCQPSGGEGIHVMFKGVPKIHHTEVYHNGRVVGSILEQATDSNGASQVTIRIDPEFRPYAGHHWAFYVDMGRLTAGRLNSSGEPLQPGDLMCGFHSKAAFNWFKVKTLLRDRIAEAGRRAEKLHFRFTRSG